MIFLILHYACLFVTAIQICIGVAGKDGVLSAPDRTMLTGRALGIVISCYVFWYLVTGGHR